MSASSEYIQLLHCIAALRAIGLILDSNSFEEKLGDDFRSIDFRARRLESVPRELSVLYGSVRATWAGVECVEEYINRDLCREYTVKFIDSAIACYQCIFRDDGLSKQRASYHQNPFFVNYGGEVLYQILEHATEIDLEEYWRVFGRKNPCVLENVSFRYDFDPKAFKVHVHPLTHLHLGDAENCRICAEGPPDPYSFFHFIVSKFYHEKLGEFEDYLSELKGFTRFPDTIDKEEHRFPHFSWGKTASVTV